MVVINKKMDNPEKRKPFDMTKVLTKAVAVTEIPRIVNRGKAKIDWLPLLNLVRQKGIIRLSEDDVVIGSVANGSREEAKKANMDIVTNTRKIDGKLYLFISKPLKR
jgi:hypothetical protein